MANKSDYEAIIEQLCDGGLWLSCQHCEGSSSDIIQAFDGGAPFHVECDCGARGPRADTPNLALAKWNERHNVFVPFDVAQRIADQKAGGIGAADPNHDYTKD